MTVNSKTSDELGQRAAIVGKVAYEITDIFSGITYAGPDPVARAVPNRASVISASLSIVAGTVPDTGGVVLTALPVITGIVTNSAVVAWKWVNALELSLAGLLPVTRVRPYVVGASSFKASLVPVTRRA